MSWDPLNFPLIYPWYRNQILYFQKVWIIWFLEECRVLKYNNWKFCFCFVNWFLKGRKYSKYLFVQNNLIWNIFIEKFLVVHSLNVKLCWLCTLACAGLGVEQSDATQGPAKTFGPETPSICPTGRTGSYVGTAKASGAWGSTSSMRGPGALFSHYHISFT